MANSKDLITLYKNGVRTIILNRPKAKNAFNRYIYETITKTLNEDALNDGIVATILTGSGEFFSSGNDIKEVLQQSQNLDLLTIVKNMVTAFIKYPKLLIAVVNGPSIGIAATTIALCDVVYVSENAYFETPFIHLGLCTEGCSSFTFPYVLGRSKSMEMLLLGKKLTAQEAYEFGFASKVIPQENIQKFITELHKYGKLSVNSVKINKKLVMQNFDKILCECNDREEAQLRICGESDEFSKGIMEFMTRKSKL